MRIKIEIENFNINNFKKNEYVFFFEKLKVIPKPETMAWRKNSTQPISSRFK